MKDVGGVKDVGVEDVGGVKDVGRVAGVVGVKYVGGIRDVGGVGDVAAAKYVEEWKRCYFNCKQLKQLRLISHPDSDVKFLKLISHQSF